MKFLGLAFTALLVVEIAAHLAGTCVYDIVTGTGKRAAN